MPATCPARKSLFPGQAYLCARLCRHDLDGHRVTGPASSTQHALLVQPHYAVEEYLSYARMLTYLVSQRRLPHSCRSPYDNQWLLRMIVISHRRHRRDQVLKCSAFHLKERDIGEAGTDGPWPGQIPPGQDFIPGRFLDSPVNFGLSYCPGGEDWGLYQLLMYLFPQQIGESSCHLHFQRIPRSSSLLECCIQCDNDGRPRFR